MWDIVMMPSTISHCNRVKLSMPLSRVSSAKATFENSGFHRDIRNVGHLQQETFLKKIDIQICLKKGKEKLLSFSQIILSLIPNMSHHWFSNAIVTSIVSVHGTALYSVDEAIRDHCSKAMSATCAATCSQRDFLIRRKISANMSWRDRKRRLWASSENNHKIRLIYPNVWQHFSRILRMFAKDRAKLLGKTVEF